MKNLFARIAAILVLLALHVGCEASTRGDDDGELAADVAGCLPNLPGAGKSFEKDGLIHAVNIEGELQEADLSASAVRSFNFANIPVCEASANILKPQLGGAFAPLDGVDAFATTKKISTGEAVELRATDFKVARIKDQTYRRVSSCSDKKGKRKSRGAGWVPVGEPTQLTCVYPEVWKVKTSNVKVAFDPGLQFYKPDCEKISPFDSVSCISRRMAIGGIVKKTYPRMLNDAQPVFQIAWHIGSDGGHEVEKRMRAMRELKFPESARLEVSSVASELLPSDKVPVRAIGFAESADANSVKSWGLPAPHLSLNSGYEPTFSIRQLPVQIIPGSPFEKIESLIKNDLFHQSSALLGWNSSLMKDEPRGTGDQDPVSTEFDRVFESTLGANRGMHVFLVWTPDEFTTYLTVVNVNPSGEIAGTVTSKIQNLNEIKLPSDLLAR